MAVGHNPGATIGNNSLYKSVAQYLRHLFRQASIPIGTVWKNPTNNHTYKGIQTKDKQSLNQLKLLVNQ